MSSLTDIVQEILAKNSWNEWLTGLVTFGLAALILYVLRKVLVAKFQSLAAKTNTKIDDIFAEALSRTRLLFLLTVAIWLAAQALALPDVVTKVLTGIVTIATFVQIGIWANAMLGHVVGHFVRLEIEEEASQVATTTALTFVGRLLLWSLVMLLTLDNLGVNINSLIASLGIGGIAVALAAQNILGDLFASLSIMFDKPFVVGDFIIVDEVMGSVERIGMKTTRIRSLSGEQLIMSNNDLLKSRIKNYKRMQERRVVFSVGVTYQTPADKLRKIPTIIRTAIEERENTRFDRSHFKGFGDSALLFETVLWIEKPDYNIMMDLMQEINLKIYGEFEKEGIEFAYPTQTIHLETETAAQPMEPKQPVKKSR